MTPSTALVVHHPSLDATRTVVDLPVTQVTLLEDRAQVRRSARVTLDAGHQRLVVLDTAPVLQDVSLRAAFSDRAAGEGAGAARVTDVRARRALRIGQAELPSDLQALQARIDDRVRQVREHTEEQRRCAARADVLVDMMHKALAEIPEDAAWSLGHPQSWSETFEALGQKVRAARAAAHDHETAAQAVQAALDDDIERRRRADRPDSRLVCVIEIDAHVDAPGAVELVIDYVVPNALWRPTHTAELRAPAASSSAPTSSEPSSAPAARPLRVSTRAAVWQNTGEDWRNVRLVFSTARSAQGHEPPKLVDDALSARRKDHKVVVQAREVAVQNAGGGRGGGALGAVTLPGVDDGGDTMTLHAPAPATVPSDGRPVFVPLSSFEAGAEVNVVAFPEVDHRAFVQATAVHTGTAPLLAGPVDLVRDHGFVGSTRVMFVAPGERFSLGFGPEDDLRVKRTAEQETEVDSVDQWTRVTHTVALFVSNLSGDERVVRLTERMPVSELEQVRVSLVAEQTSGSPQVDADGRVVWTIPVAGNGRVRLQLTTVVATAPGVGAA